VRDSRLGRPHISADQERPSRVSQSLAGYPGVRRRSAAPPIAARTARASKQGLGRERGGSRGRLRARALAARQVAVLSWLVAGLGATDALSAIARRARVRCSTLCSPRTCALGTNTRAPSRGPSPLRRSSGPTAGCLSASRRRCTRARRCDGRRRRQRRSGHRARAYGDRHGDGQRCGDRERRSHLAQRRSGEERRASTHRFLVFRRFRVDVSRASPSPTERTHRPVQQEFGRPAGRAHRQTQKREDIHCVSSGIP